MSKNDGFSWDEVDKTAESSVADATTVAASDTVYNAEEGGPPILEKEQSTSRQATYSNQTKFKASFRAIYPFLVLSGLLYVIGLFPDVVSGILFSEKDLTGLPEGIIPHVPTILKFLAWGIAGFILVVGLKTLNQGTFYICDNYVKFSKGILHTVKIPFDEVVAIDVHKNAFSDLIGTGDLEITASGKEIKIGHIYQPLALKEKLEHLIFLR